jgi:hypothetical protein
MGLLDITSGSPIFNLIHMQLDWSRLNGEYLSWSLKNGEGRDLEDLRFGQFLWSKYDNMDQFTDVFHFESCEKVYSTLLKDLYELEEKD